MVHAGWFIGGNRRVSRWFARLNALLNAGCVFQLSGMASKLPQVNSIRWKCLEEGTYFRLLLCEFLRRSGICLRNRRAARRHSNFRGSYQAVSSFLKNRWSRFATISRPKHKHGLFVFYPGSG